MPLLTTRSGCKVGWEYWSTEAEAEEASARAAEQRDRMFGQGYDFGFQWPGSVQKTNHHEHGECWVVVVP